VGSSPEKGRTGEPINTILKRPRMSNVLFAQSEGWWTAELPGVPGAYRQGVTDAPVSGRSWTLRIDGARRTLRSLRRCARAVREAHPPRRTGERATTGVRSSSHDAGGHQLRRPPPLSSSSVASSEGPGETIPRKVQPGDAVTGG
jgi:hypothetical protein